MQCNVLSGRNEESVSTAHQNNLDPHHAENPELPGPALKNPCICSLMLDDTEGTEELEIES
jgi:hypothetical protein